MLNFAPPAQSTNQELVLFLLFLTSWIRIQEDSHNAGLGTAFFSVLNVSFFEFLVIYETQKNDAFFSVLNVAFFSVLNVPFFFLSFW